MALKTLKGVTEIGGFPIVIIDELRDKYPEKFNESGSMDYKWFEEEIRPFRFIYIRNDVNSISFTLQSAPVNDVKTQRMLQDFKFYLADVTERQNAEWDTDELHKHALRCIEENSQDWKDFNAKYGNDYTGVNGCQVDTLIHAALIMLKGLNAKVGCVENDNAINKLEMALHWLGQRTIDRQQRGVEGTSKE